MKRAAVLIGVERSGDLPRLRDAARSARRMERWARSQGIDDRWLVTLTDENGGAVTLDDIKKAVRAMVDCDNPPDQLIVYFSGHGVNNGYAEYWLLSGAPQDTQAAVNVSGSEVLARYCGVQHVVLISDACRTAADGARAQRVTGGEIFPNMDSDSLENPVDIFFACTLGRPALEVHDPQITADEYSALFTSAILCAFDGHVPEVLTKPADQTSAFVHPRPLKQWLGQALSRRIASLNLKTKAIQVPDARIVSDPAHWIAQVKPGGSGGDAECFAYQAPRDVVRRGPPTAGIVVTTMRPTLATISTSLLRDALGGTLRVDSNIRPDADWKESIQEAVDQTARPFGPDHQETLCGFKVRGAHIVEAVAKFAAAGLRGSRDLVQMDMHERRSASTLLVFDSGRALVLPALAEFMTSLTFVDGDLVDIAYEPSANSTRWADFQPKADEIRALRSIASASSSRGVFRLDGDDAFEIARRMQFSKGVDPSLAIYAAYAYNDLGRKQLLRKMNDYLRDDLDMTFFDVAMHAGELDGRSVNGDSSVLSEWPMMTQGWALLDAHRIVLPEALRALRTELAQSMWTLFEPGGVTLLRTAMDRGDLK